MNCTPRPIQSVIVALPNHVETSFDDEDDAPASAPTIFVEVAAANFLSTRDNDSHAAARRPTPLPAPPPMPRMAITMPAVRPMLTLVSNNNRLDNNAERRRINLVAARRAFNEVVKSTVSSTALRFTNPTSSPPSFPPPRRAA